MRPERQDLLVCYDEQLRAEGEVWDLRQVHRLGPVLVGCPTRDTGFATHRALPSGTDLARLVGRVQGWFAGSPEVREVEWKTRSHDTRADELAIVLAGHGFDPGEPETVLAGSAQALVGPGLLQGATLRRAGDGADLASDVLRVAAVQAEVFGGDRGALAGRLLDRLLAVQGIELWLAEAGGEVVGAGRVDLVPGTAFAGLWGGAVRSDWRGRGVYRALTQARATAALARGARYLYADCTEFSRPILERCGLLAVTTTTPYVWRR